MRLKDTAGQKQRFLTDRFGQRVNAIAGRLEVDPTKQYVLLSRAVDLAVEAGDGTLAESAIDELEEVKDLTPDKAAELIMKARAHWFEEEQQA